MCIRDREKRDLVEAEQNNLKAIRERIGQLDAQIKPLEEFEATRNAHSAGAPSMRSHPTPTPGGGQDRQRLSINDRPHEYRSPGDFIVDLIRARGQVDQNIGPDPAAQQRVASVQQTRAHQTTADTPGLLPENIVGQILTDIDGSRPFVQSVGVLPLTGIPGKTFTRPHVTQHTTTAVSYTHLTLPTSELE